MEVGLMFVVVIWGWEDNILHVLGPYSMDQAHEESTRWEKISYDVSVHPLSSSGVAMRKENKL